MVFLECGFGTVAEVVGYAAHGKVHLGKAESGRFFLLTEHVHASNVALFGFDILCTLNKHTAGTAAGVIKCAVERLDKSGYEFDNIVRSVKLAVLFGGVHRKRLQEILIDAPD